MVTVSRSRSSQVQPLWVNSAGLSRIVGFTCVAGFLSDVFVAAMPVAIRSEQWRMNLLQQMGDRGIILLFGLALIALGYPGQRLIARRIGLVSLMVGVFFLLSCLSFSRDALMLQTFENNRVDAQISELQHQVQQEDNPETQGQMSQEQMQQAMRQINSQAKTYKQNVRATTVRVGLSALSNLLITGIAFISLGRYCMQAQRSR